MNLPLLLTLYGLIIFGICVKIIMDTEDPSKALAYVALVVFLPVFGTVLYFSVGVNYRKNEMYKKKLDIDKAAFKQLEAITENYSTRLLAQAKNTLKHFYPLATLVAKNSITTDKNQASLFINGEEKFPDVIASLKEAKHHIHIEYYIYEDDQIGTQIADILKQKAKQGVQVRFIYDDFGSRKVRKKFIADLIDAGIEAVPFYKIKFLLFANRINYRNHRKIFVIDGVIAYIGGINIADRYINSGKNELYWRDTHAKLVGPAAFNVQYIFLTDWNFCANQHLSIDQSYFPMQNYDGNLGNKLVQISASGPDSIHPNIMYSLIQAIMLSKKEILITTPYFIPTKSFNDALIIASLGGVKIKLLVPGIADSIIVNATSNAYYGKLLSCGIEIYKYQKGFVHAKTMVCDEFVSVVGTANLDQRSFDLNFEVNSIIYSKEFAGQLRNSFMQDIENAERIDLEAWLNRPHYVNFFERTARLFSPLM